MVRVRFWRAIAEGAKTGHACVEAGVSEPVGFRWFVHAGGVNPRLPPELSARYLSSWEVVQLRRGAYVLDCIAVSL